MKKMRASIATLVASIPFSLGYVGINRLLATGSPRSWPATVSDQLALGCVQQSYAALDAEVAAITTDDQKRSAILGICNRARAIDKASEKLLREVRTRLSLTETVALVQSGETWVERK